MERSVIHLRARARWAVALGGIALIVPGGLFGQTKPARLVTPTIGLSLGYSSLDRTTYTLTEVHRSGAVSFISLNRRGALGGPTVTLSGGVRVGRLLGALVQATSWVDQGGGEPLTALLGGISVRSGDGHASVLQLTGGPVKLPVEDASETGRFDVRYRATGQLGREQLARQRSARGVLVQLAAGYERRLRDWGAAEVLVHWAVAGAKDSTGFQMWYHQVGARIGLVFLLKTHAEGRSTVRRGDVAE